MEIGICYDIHAIQRRVLKDLLKTQNIVLANQFYLKLQKKLQNPRIVENS